MPLWVVMKQTAADRIFSMANVRFRLKFAFVFCWFYFSRNNGYAISTPTKDQYRGDGIGKMIMMQIFVKFCDTILMNILQDWF
jgi:hypothetical protein